MTSTSSSSRPESHDLELRELDLDRFGEWLSVQRFVFQAPRPTQANVDFRLPVLADHRLTAAHDLRGGLGSPDPIVATYRSFDTDLSLPGGLLGQVNAVSSVTVLPTHRRRGLLTAMMQRDLRAAVERGAPASILIASEAAIYGRFGFGMAAEAATWHLDPASVRWRREVPGRVELVSEQVLRDVAPGLYRSARAHQPGAIGRTDSWWDESVGLRVPPEGPDRHASRAVYLDGEGKPGGFVQFKVEEKWEHRRSSSRLVVQELCAATDDAYQGLWRFCCEVDFTTLVVAEDRAVAEPLPWLLTDHRAARQVSRTDFLWIRLLDVPNALGARRYSAPGTVVLDVADPAGIAGGRFALTVDDEGSGTVEPVTDSGASEAGLALGVETLAAAYLGATSLSGLARAGLVEVRDASALVRATAMFASPDAPWCGTWF